MSQEFQLPIKSFLCNKLLLISFKTETAPNSQNLIHYPLNIASISLWLTLTSTTLNKVSIFLSRRIKKSTHKQRIVSTLNSKKDKSDYFESKLSILIVHDFLYEVLFS